ncbi:MAG: hypothetical protein GTN68_40540, partial [Candidatus Aminicenantes bacterium]|nr:hypothetical protein [Candidatus Aminicenantes bacterium]NIO86856.1 hypothetical protein [Candidatus Aminicenantes bacterium]
MKESLEIKDPQDPEILRAIQLGFELKSQYEEHSLLVEPRYSHEESFNSVLKKLGGTGLYPVYRKTQDGYSLKIVDKKGKRKEIRPLFHV